MTVAAVRQTRSQNTLEMLLDALETLGARRSFDQITVNEIAASAGFTVGALYGRFAGKDGLLHGLEQRLRRLIEQERQALRATRDETTDIRVRVDRLVTRVANLYRSRRGLLLLLRSASDPQLAARIVDVNREILELLADAIGHGLPVERIHLETAVLLLTTSLRELVLKRELLPELGADDDGERLKLEIARAITAYLASVMPSGSLVPPGPPRSRRRRR